MFERKFIESFLNGYSEEEKEKIKKDLKIVESVTFDMAKSNNASSTPVYLATAGSPGSAKTTTLEAYLRQNQLEHYVYADPDQVSLKNMNFTYRKSLTNFDFAVASSNHMTLKLAYDKWRGASNYLYHEMLQIAFGNNDGAGPRYSVAHGTTSTSPHAASLYQKVKALGYKINLLLCYSQDETRKQAVARREKEQAFVQTDPNDVISKGTDFSKRFDIYFNYADEIHFYWNDGLTHGNLPMPCASFTRTADGPVLTVLNETDWISFCKKYLRDTQKNNIEICKAFEQFIPKSVLDSEKRASLEAEVKATPSAQSTSTHSGKIRFWGVPDSEDSLCRNQVRANTYPRP